MDVLGRIRHLYVYAGAPGIFPTHRQKQMSPPCSIKMGVSPSDWRPVVFFDIQSIMVPKLSKAMIYKSSAGKLFGGRRRRGKRMPFWDQRNRKSGGGLCSGCNSAQNKGMHFGDNSGSYLHGGQLSRAVVFLYQRRSVPAIVPRF